MLKNNRITFITSNDENMGSTRVRVYKIVEELRKRGYDVSVNEKQKKADVVVFQKSDYKYLEKMFFKYLFSNKLIIYDVDDLMLGNHLNLVRFSDSVIAGSQYLKDSFLKYNKQIFVLDDALDFIDEDIPLKNNYNLLNPQVGWFGSVFNLHLLDKFGIKNVKTITKGGDIEWSKETVDKNIQKFDLLVIPQEKTPFGLSKGNNRMLKSLYLGVPCLVSDIPPYIELAKLVNYPKDFIVKDGEDWNERIEQIKSGKIKFDFDFEKCRNILIENYNIKVVVSKWLEIIHNSKKRNKTIGDYILLFYEFVIKRLANPIKKCKSGNKRTITFYGIPLIKYLKTTKSKK